MEKEREEEREERRNERKEGDEKGYPRVLELRPIALALRSALALSCAVLAFSGVCAAALRKKISSSSSIMSSSVFALRKNKLVH
jgi:hypothetical protein